MKRGRNYLITKDDFDKGKPGADTLPKGGFAYGLAAEKDIHGAHMLTSEW